MSRGSGSRPLAASTAHACMADPFPQIGITADVPLLPRSLLPLPSYLRFGLRCLGVWHLFSASLLLSSLGFRAEARRRRAGVSVAASGGGKLEAATAYLARKNRFSCHTDDFLASCAVVVSSLLPPFARTIECEKHS